MRTCIGRLEAAIGLGLMLAIGISMFQFGAECAAVREEVLRIHILADSDTEADQALKLRVRDAVLEDLADWMETDGSLPATTASVREHLDRVEAVANMVLAEAEAGYQAHAELTEMYFSTRTYSRGEQSFSLPAGRYQALRVTLGSGQGHNWWCVAYPPLCIDAAVEGEAALIAEEIEELNDTVVYKPKLAVVEMVESLREKIGI